MLLLPLIVLADCTVATQPTFLSFFAVFFTRSTVVQLRCHRLYLPMAVVVAFGQLFDRRVPFCGIHDSAYYYILIYRYSTLYLFILAEVRGIEPSRLLLSALFLTFCWFALLESFSVPDAAMHVTRSMSFALS